MSGLGNQLGGSDWLLFFNEIKWRGKKNKKRASHVIKVNITSCDVPSHYVKFIPSMGYGQIG